MTTSNSTSGTAGDNSLDDSGYSGGSGGSDGSVPPGSPGGSPAGDRSVAVIGAGINGANAALALRSAGFSVTLYSDRERAALRDDVPATGTAILFGASREHDERIVGGAAGAGPGTSVGDPYGDDAAFTASAVSINGGPTFDAAYDYEAQSVDVRLRADDRIGRFLELGGRFEVLPVDRESLDGIAAAHDATLVATGKGGLADLFPVDPERTPYSEPQRYLLTVTVSAPEGEPLRFPGRTERERAALLSIDLEEGEVFAGPYIHKDAGPSWVLLGFARPGTATAESYRTATDPASALEAFRAQHRAQFPDVAPQIEALSVIDSDPHSWLKGAVTPTVRRPIARTSGGHLVAAIGDTAIAVDPIAGQGAQLGAIQVAALADSLAAAAARDEPWDEQLLSALFEAHWDAHGRASVEATSLFLADPRYTDVVGAFFGAAEGDPVVGTALFDLLSTPGPVLGLRGGDDVERFVRAFAESPDAARQSVGAGSVA